MKVKELIKILESADQDSMVYCSVGFRDDKDDRINYAKAEVMCNDILDFCGVCGAELEKDDDNCILVTLILNQIEYSLLEIERMAKEFDEYYKAKE